MLLFHSSASFGLGLPSSAPGLQSFFFPRDLRQKCSLPVILKYCSFFPDLSDPRLLRCCFTCLCCAFPMMSLLISNFLAVQRMFRTPSARGVLCGIEDVLYALCGVVRGLARGAPWNLPCASKRPVWSAVVECTVPEMVRPLGYAVFCLLTRFQFCSFQSEV